MYICMYMSPKSISISMSISMSISKSMSMSISILSVYIDIIYYYHFTCFGILSIPTVIRIMKVTIKVPWEVYKR